jgi:hypothetical protein
LENILEETENEEEEDAIILKDEKIVKEELNLEDCLVKSKEIREEEVLGLE